MQGNTASQTALGTALFRAAHQILDRAPLLFADPVAMPLLGAEGEAHIRTRQVQLQTPQSRELRAHVCLRARVAEERLAEAVAAGTDCYVLLGAGFDTFSWRQPDWARGMRIVEIDHPATQDAKRRRLAEAGLAIPDNLDFVAADFACESVADVLARSGIARANAVFFSWLGVSMYLSDEAVDSCLAAMANYRARLVMTFRQPSTQNDGLCSQVSALGEPFVSLFTVDEIQAKLNAHDFGETWFWTPERMAAYLTASNTDLPVPRLTNIVYAAKV